MNTNKSLWFSAMVLFAMLALWACGGPKSAKEVGEKYLLSMAEGDLQSAKEYASTDAQAFLEMLGATFDGKKVNPDKIEIGEVKEEGDSATLLYKENGSDKMLFLVKELGVWKAAWTMGVGNEAEIDDMNDGLEKAMDAAHAESVQNEPDTTAQEVVQ